jgi:predicted nucleic acid-binding protein
VQTSGRYAYLDTSAFVKLCWPEPESAALVRYLRDWPLLASCALVRTEALRAAARQPVPRLAGTRRQLLAVALIDIDRPLLEHAGSVAPREVRSLDAVHVAAALALGPDLGVVVTYDQRMADAAQAQGLDVVAPGSGDPLPPA